MDGLLPADVDIADVDFSEEPSNTFIAGEDQIAGVNDGLQAITQTVHIILTTRRYDYQIYTGNFGVSFDDLIGADKDYVRAAFPERVKDAFSVDDRIISAQNFNFDFEGDVARITFDVVTVYGTINTEVQL